MDLQHKIDRVRAIALFGGMAEDDLRQLTLGMTERSFQLGELLIREGDPGEEVFLILEGQVQAYLSEKTLGFEKELRRAGPGDHFGEIAVLTGGKRVASIRALTPGRALVIHRKQLHDLLGRSPGATIALCRVLATYVERAIQEVPAIAFVKLDDYKLTEDLKKLIPQRISLFCRAIAIEKQAESVTIALVSAQDESTRSFLRDVLRAYRLDFVAINEADFDRYRTMHLAGADADVPAQAEIGALNYLGPDDSEEPLGQHETGVFLQNVFSQAISSGVSDIHLEPGAGGGRVRLRLDGRMFALPDSVPHKLYAQIVSRLKIMSELDLTNKRLPQDGQFTLKNEQRQVQVRLSATPCQGGEKVVMRVLDPSLRKLDLQNLILSSPVAMLVKEMFQAPSGLLLVCGPTGSGKTTTLYAGLNEIWAGSQALNIVTAEDPVEYQLDYATQIAVNRTVGLDFPQILRTILRQDPDVLLVGEIRDQESAGIALEAAVTGHLVLSSLHTDTALDSITRLRNLQVKSYLLAGALRGVICQQLVPRVCKKCAEPVGANEESVLRLKQIGVLEQNWSGTLQRGRGCDICRAQGELGRVAVFEILAVNSRLRELIEANASWTELNSALCADMFIPMRRYARFLLESGSVAPERIREIFPAERLAASGADLSG